jgi:magnesium-transporting ATPase (P-type)
MTAKLIVVDKNYYDVEGEGYDPKGTILFNNTEADLSKSNPLTMLLQTAWVCNEAEIRKDDGTWRLIGEPTEGALKTLGLKAGLRDFQPERLDDIPFDSEHKYMATLNLGENGKIIYIKGAPERLLDMSNKQLTAAGEKDLEKQFWLEKIDELAAKGMRMLGTAYKIPSGNTNELEKANVEDGAVFLGLVGLIDPPRKEAIEAVKHCKDAGIRVKMITGDHKITAKAIAAQMNIGHGENVVDGKSMDRMTDEELQKAVMENDVFARTSPEHKVRLIKALRANNLISAMTGDGVNDAPSLKTADVGIAMGIKGTEVAKDTAEMVLADDNFASISNAVEEGRTVYDNLRKALIFILPTNGSESLVIVIAVILGITMPISPAQILWVNMVTAVTLALALSFEPMEKDVMKNPPRDPEKSIIGGYFLFRIIYISLLLGGSVIAIFLWLINQHELIVSRTVAVNSLVAGELFYLLNCRKLRHHPFEKDFVNNKAVIIACVTLVLLQGAFTYVPFMNEIFASSPITGNLMLYPLMVGLGIFLIVELEKWVVNRWNLLA